MAIVGSCHEEVSMEQIKSNQIQSNWVTRSCLNALPLKSLGEGQLEEGEHRVQNPVSKPLLIIDLWFSLDGSDWSISARTSPKPSIEKWSNSVQIDSREWKWNLQRIDKTKNRPAHQINANVSVSCTGKRKQRDRQREIPSKNVEVFKNNFKEIWSSGFHVWVKKWRCWKPRKRIRNELVGFEVLLLLVWMLRWGSGGGACVVSKEE